MEKETLEKDIKVLCVKAKSFPDGVLEAHQKLHALVPFSTDRKYFGLSRPEKGSIEYKAAMEEINEGEAEEFNLETLTLKKGKYISETIHDFMKNIPAIGNTFQQMLQTPGLDPDGYCVEWYINDKDVKCMIRLDNE